MTSTAILIGFGVQELALILVIVLVIFGAKQVPLLMRGLGQGVKEFKSAVNDDETEKPAEIKDKNSVDNSS